jgi:CRISPR/Cas system-associated exonuclease Cas4 (RecB family)
MPETRSAVVGRGPRAVEALLFAELDRLEAAAHLDPAALARPVRVVVPSTSLAQHLSERLARRAGRPLLGVSIRTVHAVACDIVQRAGRPLPAGEGLVDVMVRRAARDEPALAALADLVDGHVAVAASVRDLLDAGLEPAHAEAFEDAREAEPRSGDLALRARAVVRIACGIARAIEEGRFGHRSRLFRVARESLEESPEAALPSRAILIHGFSDATGVVTDLLEALVQRAGATLFLDRPPDPAEPEREDPGVRFTERFALRVLGAPPPEPAGPAPATRLRVLHAPGAWAEARAVADELRAALDAHGSAPERLGVVARDLAGHRVALRSQLRRLAVPFSGLGEVGPPGPGGRRLSELRVVLRDAARARADQWLELVELDRPEGRLTPALRADLRIGLQALGAARVGQVASLPTAEEGATRDQPLPVRARIAAGEDGAASVRRRVLPRALLDAAIGRARDLLARLRARDERARAPLADRTRELRDLVRVSLGWRADDPGARELEAALADGVLGPPELPIDAEELRLLLERRLAGEIGAPLGGKGGGVQILTVTEARARCFDRLWLAGLSRDVFPRAVNEDPLLPDSLRLRLRALLPDLALKRDGHDEERFLFAQLAAASAEVALLASTCDDDGRARELSPFVERLRVAPDGGGPELVPSPTAPEALAASAVRPAHERALLAGLHGSPAAFEALLPVAIEEARRELGAPGIDADALAAARLAVLRELDAPAHRGAPLGPYFGFVGRLRDAADPRRGPIAVTTLERLFRCPWQTYLARVLRIEAPPDVDGELPAADGRAVGSLVHRVIERVACDALGDRVESLAQAAAHPGVVLAWPPPDALQAIAIEVARELLEEEGVALPGFERVLALAARDALALACDVDAAERGGGVRLVGSEVQTLLELADAAHALRLRIDRVDRHRDALVLSDYKTGKPTLEQKQDAKRREALLRAIGSGELLQASAYAASALAEAGGGRGRYLYLHAAASEQTRELSVDAADRELAEAFDGAVSRALAAWDAGSFFPRLHAPGSENENRECQRCALKEACVRGDSSARGRLARWTAEPPAAPSDAERALLGLWRPEDPA